MGSMLEVNKKIHETISDFADIYEAWEHRDLVIYRCLFALETDFMNIIQSEKDYALVKTHFVSTDGSNVTSMTVLAEAVLHAIESDPVYFKKFFEHRYYLYLLFHYISSDKINFVADIKSQEFLLYSLLMVESKLWHLDAPSRVAFMQDYKMECLHILGLLIQGYTVQEEELEAFLAWESRLVSVKASSSPLMETYKQLKLIFKEVRSEWQKEQDRCLHELYASIDPIDLQSILPSRKPSLVERLKEFARTVACYVWASK